VNGNDSLFPSPPPFSETPSTFELDPPPPFFFSPSFLSPSASIRRQRGSSLLSLSIQEFAQGHHLSLSSFPPFFFFFLLFFLCTINTSDQLRRCLEVTLFLAFFFFCVRESRRGIGQLEGFDSLSPPLSPLFLRLTTGGGRWKPVDL